MKFEKISDNAFQAFASNAVQNLNAIIGGTVDTSSGGRGNWHDTAYTSSGGNLDDVRKTADGKSDDSKGAEL